MAVQMKPLECGFVTLCIVLLICSVCIIIGFFYGLNKSNQKLPCIILLPTIILYILSIATFIAWIYHTLHYNEITRIFVFNLYGYQTYFFVVVQFIRIFLVFRNTRFKLSKLTIYFYKVIFTVFVILATTCNIVIRFEMSHISPIIIAVTISIVTIINLALTILFVRKLVTVKSSNEEDQSILRLVAKNTMLTCISTIFTLCLVLWIIIVRLEEASQGINNVVSVPLVIEWYIAVIDEFTKCLCISLAFKFFQTYYDSICGKAENKCMNCLVRIKPKDSTLTRKTLNMTNVNSNSMAATATHVP